MQGFCVISERPWFYDEPNSCIKLCLCTTTLEEWVGNNMEESIQYLSATQDKKVAISLIKPTWRVHHVWGKLVDDWLLSPVNFQYTRNTSHKFIFCSRPTQEITRTVFPWLDSPVLVLLTERPSLLSLLDLKPLPVFLPLSTTANTWQAGLGFHASTQCTPVKYGRQAGPCLGSEFLQCTFLTFKCH